MHFIKPFGMLTGVIMISLALAVPVIDGPVNAVRNPVFRTLDTVDDGVCSGGHTSCA
jgi:hypothetical protein